MDLEQSRPADIAEGLAAEGVSLFAVYLFPRT